MTSSSFSLHLAQNVLHSLIRLVCKWQMTEIAFIHHMQRSFNASLFALNFENIHLSLLGMVLYLFWVGYAASPAARLWFCI